MLYESPFKPVGHDGPCHEPKLPEGETILDLPEMTVTRGDLPPGFKDLGNGWCEPEAQLALVDRTGWPEGEWDTEPDREAWTTEAGYSGLAIRNQLGAWCGYVAIPEGHQYYGIDYDDPRVEVHGGLSYAQPLPPPQQAIGLPPTIPGEPWWFGFDCGHAGDLIPDIVGALNARDPLGAAHRFYVSGTYRNLAYAKDQVEHLAQQLKDKA